MKVQSLDHLHLGCGLSAPPGWLNVDGSWQVLLARHLWIKRLLVTFGILPRKLAQLPWASNVIRLNLAKPLPFRTATFVAVYSSHTLEHLYHSNALSLLKECYRVLKPGGVCRVVVPDLLTLVEGYMQKRQRGDAEAATHFMQEMLAHDQEPRHGFLGTIQRFRAYDRHKWMYDDNSMQSLLTAAGFVDVRKEDALVSRIARIEEVENPDRVLNGGGVAIEGVKV